MEKGKAVRRGGTFAKRNAASSKLSKKIGWLNSHGGLTAEIRYMEVKDLLTKVGDDEAWSILNNLETKGAAIQNPTAYIITSAKNSLDGKGPNRRAGRQRGRRASRADRGEARDTAEQGEGGDGEAEANDEAVEDQDGAENDEGEAAEEEGGDDQAPRSRRRRDRGGSDLRDQVEKRVQWLNENGGLNGEVKAGDVVDGLVGLGMRDAMIVLKQLEEKAGEVNNPTAWLASAVMKRGTKGRGKGADRRVGRASARGEARPPIKRVLKSGIKLKERVRPAARREEEDPLVDKVQKRISWLNDKAGLAEKLSYERVGDLLLRSGPIGEIMKIFKTLEESASEVRNPNAWVANAAKRLQEEGTAPEPKSSVTGHGPNSKDFRNESLDKQLRAHVAWMNAEVELNSRLDFNKVSSFLLELDTADAGEILRRLEESAKEVRDPTSYVIKAAERALAQSGRGGPRREAPHREVSEQAPRGGGGGGGGSADEEKLAKRIDWLNRNLDMAAPLDYERVAPDLLTVGYHCALEVLNNLEEHAGNVRDPNAYVVAGARKLVRNEGASSGSGPASSSHGGRSSSGKGGGKPAMAALPPPPAPPPPAPRGRSDVRREGRGGDSNEDKLHKRLEWLGRNKCRGEPLQSGRVMDALLRLPPSQAFDVLRNFEENADTVRDPNAYIISHARRAAPGGGGGKSGGRDGDRERSRGVPKPPEPKAPEARSSRQPPPRSASRGPAAVGSRAEPIGSFSASRRGVSDRGGARSADGPRDNGRGGRDSNEGRLRKRMDWLNDKAGLQAGLDADLVAPQLARVPDRDAMEILKRLEESADTVRDPTGYVISAMRRVIDGGKGGGKKGKSRGPRD